MINISNYDFILPCGGKMVDVDTDQVSICNKCDKDIFNLPYECNELVQYYMNTTPLGLTWDYENGKEVSVNDPDRK